MRYRLLRQRDRLRDRSESYAVGFVELTLFAEIVGAVPPSHTFEPEEGPELGGRAQNGALHVVTGSCDGSGRLS
jgi:hypothetical protein